MRKRPPLLHHQNGMADSASPLLMLLIFATGATYVAIFSASILVPAIRFKGKQRLAILAVVAIFWTGIYMWNATGSTLRRLAHAHCLEEENSLPHRFPVDGFTDEGAAIRNQDILSILTERRIKFIEIKTRGTDKKNSLIAYPDGDQEGSWHVSHPPGSFVRLEIGAKGDPDCLDLKAHPFRDRIDRPPFLPDTCVKATYSDKAHARYALILDPKGSPHGWPYSAWTLVDRSTQQRIAALTTIDKPDTVNSGRFEPSDRPATNNCNAPYTMMADRIVGLAGQTIEGLVTPVQVVTDVNPNDIETALKNIPTIIATETSVQFMTDEEKRLYNASIEPFAWKGSVEKAKVEGTAGYHSMIFDWESRQLISLVSLSSQLEYPWQVIALKDGFFVFSSNTEWRSTTRNLLAHYAADGRLRWAVNIESPRQPSEIESCKFKPVAITATHDVLVLSGSCSTESGLRWKIPLSAVRTRDTR